MTIYDLSCYGATVLAQGFALLPPGGPAATWLAKPQISVTVPDSYYFGTISDPLCYVKYTICDDTIAFA
jgi:hypothetical protein